MEQIRKTSRFNLTRPGKRCFCSETRKHGPVDFTWRRIIAGPLDFLRSNVIFNFVKDERGRVSRWKKVLKNNETLGEGAFFFFFIKIIKCLAPFQVHRELTSKPRDEKKGSDRTSNVCSNLKAKIQRG